MSEQINTDVVIVGGGIAGLWLSARLHQLGYGTLLIENNTLGGGQTVKSQGIIHGGTKYALQGALTSASEAISQMPARWRESLEGTGELDLSGANILSQYHYLWSPGGLAKNIMGFFASKALRARVKQVKDDELPEGLQNSAFKGKAYRLNELVLDIPTIIERLVVLSAKRVLRASRIALLERSEQGITIKADDYSIHCQRIVFSAGEGTESLMQAFNLEQPKMQRRPLHMVMVKAHTIKPMYAHCLGNGSKPRITITTHYHQDGTPVWYLGGELAEANGVARDADEQIAFAKKELAKLLPWIDLSHALWETLRVDRAEPAQSTLTRPDSAFISKDSAIMVGWPTKLALAPDFADQCIALLGKDNIKPQYNQPLPELPAPLVASCPWDDLFA